MKCFGKLAALIIIVLFVTFNLCYAQNDLEETYHKGLDYLTQGKFKKAISYFDKIVEINPRSSKAYGSRGFAYMKLGNTDMACADWERACELGRCANYNIAARKGMCE
ncbi:MAG: tetratricopeptide repeat protein [Deltaproteobacteria bacterium]|nr:tetratricopeptide repeat protein [Deltaproteobacteria bacterium]